MTIQGILFCCNILASKSPAGPAPMIQILVDIWLVDILAFLKNWVIKRYLLSNNNDYF